MLERLTFYRFWAALVVVFYHFADPLFGAGTAQSWAGQLFLPGPIAVSFFYTLSGFVMASVYPDLTLAGARDYWIARLARIYPVYALALVASILLFRPNTIDILLSGTMLQAFVPGHVLAVNAPGWSLSVEVFFYALFPFLMPYVRRIGLRAFTFFAITAWIAAQAWSAYLLNAHYQPYPSAEHDVVFYFPLSHLPSFLLGMVAGTMVKARYVRLTARGARLTILLTVCLYAALVLGRNAVSALFGFTFTVEVGMLAPVFAALCVGLFFLPTRWTVAPTAIFLGEASYAAYILQLPFMNFAMMKLQDQGMEVRTASWIAVLGLLCVSALVFWFYERPLRMLLRRLGSARSVPRAHIA